VETVNRMAPSVERALATAESAPKLIASEREAAIKALQDELSRSLRFAREERTAALAHITGERIAALKEAKDDLVVERQAMTRDLEQISLKVVDHAMWRAAQIVAATVAMLVLAAVVLLLTVRRMLGQR